MTIENAAFEGYRRSPNEKTTLPRLFFGSAIVIAFWMAMTALVLFAGTYAYIVWRLPGPSTGQYMQDFLASPVGILSALTSFAGIWIGLWEIARGPIAFSSWLLFLIPIALLAFLQTSSEEMLFRGYLLRGLAYRFRSPLIWAVLPGLLFTSLHWNSASTLAINACILVSIGIFALLLTLLVYVTGNLGAGFGAHLGNNLTGFLLISHQEGYNGFALLNAKPLEGPGWTNLDAVLIAAIGIVSTLLTMLLLLHRRSPLRVGVSRQSLG
ncbi:MAG: CPBP family intramembrane metalloprotease [Mesorhizobium sp.]|nr:MAG: CPBP family intramembrane metalloprotease [Mesorhizobium sp.]